MWIIGFQGVSLVSNPALIFAVRMGLPEKRISELVKRAMRVVPMPADPNPVDIAYEDADLIAVVKPPGKAWPHKLCDQPV